MCNNNTCASTKKKKRRQFFMRSGKKSIAVLAAVLALVLAVQAFAFTAVKLGTSDAADSVEAGVTRQVMDAKPENKTTVVKVTQSADGSDTSGMTSMKPVTESIAPSDVADTANNVKVLSEEDTKTLTEIAEKKIKDENITVSDGEVVFIPKEELPAEAAEIKISARVLLMTRTPDSFTALTDTDFSISASISIRSRVYSITPSIPGRDISVSARYTTSALRRP